MNIFRNQPPLKEMMFNAQGCAEAFRGKVLIDEKRHTPYITIIQLQHNLGIIASNLI